MRPRVWLGVLVMMLTGTFSKAAVQDSTGMPGDNLDLYAVMDLFKRSPNLEEFEKSLNDPDNNINNLDLNKDGETDYIRVLDNSESDAHAIILQVPVNETESQDVAVIELEKEGVENAKIQIVGDDDVYGDDYVVEPYENYVGKDEWDAQHQSQQNNTTVVNETVIVNVWTWPCVTYIYGPVYRPWRSPWYWGYYPRWWRPWRPHPWHVYHGHVWHYHGPGYYYRPAYHHHVKTAHRVYHGHRTSSPTYRRSVPDQTRRSAQQMRRSDNSKTMRGNNGRESGRNDRNVDRSRSKRNGNVQSRSRRNQDIAPREQQRPKQNVNPRQQQPKKVTPRQPRQNRQVSPGGGRQGRQQGAPRQNRRQGGRQGHR